ncbi:MAG: hypothetical protein M1381_06865 [Deltaproteobacteria bacterium]|nr:hypothetical protein [Deltaproteobacteria bacterium]MCL5792970.1 hypothetical protein [Deltaproteobacteria bacterium]
MKGLIQRIHLKTTWKAAVYFTAVLNEQTDFTIAFFGLTILATLSGLSGCTPAINIQSSFRQANNAYERLSTLYPNNIDTQGYRVYMAKAESSKANGDYESANKFAIEAKIQADRSYDIRLKLKQAAKSKVELARIKLDRLLVPSNYSIEQFFKASDAYRNGNYRKAITLANDASIKLDIDAQTAFSNTITLYVPDNLKARFSNYIPVFSFIGNDFKLHKLLERVKGPVRVEFIEQFFINKNFSYFHIKSTKLHLDGWVYPQFVIIGNIKEVK